MTNLELIFNMLAEVTTKEISEKEDPSDLNRNQNQFLLLFHK